MGDDRFVGGLFARGEAHQEGALKTTPVLVVPLEVDIRRVPMTLFVGQDGVGGSGFKPDIEDVLLLENLA